MDSMSVIYDDDEIQLLYERSPTFKCAICSADLTKLSVPQRQAHYDAHISSQSSAATSSTAGPSTSRLILTSSTPSQKGKQRVFPPQENVFWHPLDERPPPENYSPGLIPVLKKALTKSHDKDQTQRAWLCHNQAVHISPEHFSRMWGCGYQNFLMSCAALMVQSKQPMYFPLLDDPTPPGIRNLQTWIEEAWEHGFDKDGADQLDHHLAGTRKWIGTAEVHVAFTYRGIPSQLVDFKLKLDRNVDILLNWVLEYFSDGGEHSKNTTVDQALRAARPIIVTDKMPLILQHAGHSRTVVGCEQTKNGSINLLVFDPSQRIPSGMRKAGLVAANRDKTSHQGLFASSSILQQVPASVTMYQSSKCKPNSTSSDSSIKRTRSASSHETHPRDEPIVIDDDDDDEVEVVEVKNAANELDYSSVLKTFRLSSRKLGSKDRYQILSFPLDPPWDESERRSRQEVFSIVVK